jgi:hypothetical protein
MFLRPELPSRVAELCFFATDASFREESLSTSRDQAWDGGLGAASFRRSRNILNMSV